MITWLDRRMIAPFFVIWLFFFVLPFLLPAIHHETLGKTIDLSILAYPRQFVVNELVLPLLPTSMANSLVAWWMEASYVEELLLHVLVALNLYIPFAIVLFVFLECYMRIHNYFYTLKFKMQTKVAK